MLIRATIVGTFVTCLLLPGCGGSHTMAATGSPGPVVGVDRHLSETQRWGSPRVRRQADGQFLAQLSPDTGSGDGHATGPVTVRLGGIGWSRDGEGDGQLYVGPGVLSKWTSQNATYSVSLTTNARSVSLVVWSLGGQYQVRVGSRALGVPESAGKAYYHHSLDVEFPSSAPRTITFELSGGVYFSGLKVGGSHAHVVPPALPDPPPPSVYWLGDSYVAGGGASYPGFDDLTHLASERAGLSDVTVDALGGTGYIHTNEAAQFPDYLTRARLNLGGSKARPQLIVVGGSINDGIYGTTEVKNAAARLYRYLARAVPAARVIVVPFTSAYPVPQGVAVANRGILAAARAAPNVVGVLDLPARVLALGGSAAAERESGALDSRIVKYHPSEAGHRLYGQIIGSFLTDCLKTLKSKGPSRGVCDQRS